MFRQDRNALGNNETAEAARVTIGLRILRALDWALARTLILGVRMYQVTLGPFLGGHCRFVPTCSRYFIQAVEKYGGWRGGLRGIRRLARCHPFHPGGVDYP